LATSGCRCSAEVKHNFAWLEGAEATKKKQRGIAAIFRRDLDAIYPHCVILAKICQPRRGFCVSIFKRRK
jgi:hypothetical protein